MRNRDSVPQAEQNYKLLIDKWIKAHPKKCTALFGLRCALKQKFRAPICFIQIDALNAGVNVKRHKLAIDQLDHAVHMLRQFQIVGGDDRPYALRLDDRFQRFKDLP